MTSLAKQLERLAIPHTQALLGEDKKKLSLLFDPKTAASIDRETFHSLGYNGLLELENIDETFEEFEAPLYGDASLSFERSVQSKESNEKINNIIRRFLIKLSPYCLLRPAHKALEWLIQRFYINYYNIDDLLLCFLPYHETKIFARVLQVIKFDSKLKSKWDFLAAGQASGLHLPKKALVKYCVSNTGFLSFVCELVPKSVKVLAERDKDVKKGKVLFSFYATTVIAVLESGNVTEELIGMLLPNITKGIYSDVLDYKAASYMILSQVLYKAKLNSNVLKSLQKVIGKSIVQDLAGEAIACFMLMFQTQDVNFLKGHRYLCRDYFIIDSITELSAQFESKKFLLCFLTQLIPAAFKDAVGMATSGEDSCDREESRGRFKAEYVAMLHRLLSNIKLPEDLAEETAYYFLKVYVKHGKAYFNEDIDDRVKEILQGIVRQLEGKHSSEVDKAVSRMLKECETKQEKELVQEFLNLFVLSVPRQLVTDSETSLVLSLNHRLPVVREKAVTTLIQNRQAVEDNTFLKESLMLRLKDDDIGVVKAALQIGKEIWTVVGDDTETISLLQRLLFLGLRTKAWSEVAVPAVELLGSYSGVQDQEAVSSVMSCFFMTSISQPNITIINSLLSSPLAKQNVFLRKIAKAWNKKQKTPEKERKSESLADINMFLARCVAESFVTDLSSDMLDMIKDLCVKALKMEDHNLSCLLMVSMDTMVTMVTDESLKLDILMILLELVDKLNVKHATKSESGKVDFLKMNWIMIIERNLKKIEGKHMPAEFVLKSLQTIVTTVAVPNSLVKGPGFWQYCEDGKLEDKFLVLAIKLYDLLTSGALTDGNCKGIHQYMLKHLEKSCFDKPEIYLKFLGLLWTQHSNDLADDLHLTLYLQAKSLHLGLPYVKQLPNLEDFLAQNQNVFVNLLFVLTSPVTDIRKCGQEYFKYMYETCKETGLFFTPLLKKIVHCEGEISTDYTYIAKVMYSVFKSTSPVQAQTVKTPKTRRSMRKSKSEGKADSIMDEKKPRSLQSLLSLIIDKDTPYFVQHQLLNIFSHLNNEDTLTFLLPLMERLLSLNPTQGSLSSKPTQCLNLLIQRFSVDSVGCMASKKPGLKLFLQALKVSEGAANTSSPQLTAILQLTFELYSIMEERAQHEVLSAVFDVYMDSDQIEVASQIRKTLKHLQLDGIHIKEELKKCLKVSGVKTVREAKRQKRVPMETNEEGMTEFDSKMWQRVTIILEAVQNKKKLTNYITVGPVCFQLLASILESDNHTSAEYLKQLILGVLQNICGRIEKSKEEGIVPEEEFNMDLIVNCIRSSDNPQTHHQALLLLTSAAKIYPEHLLHNMMSVFTFMGANTLRQDDAYSFQIISKILETVIPALIMACEQRKNVPKGITNDLNDIITMVVQVFVDSYPHIPRHRRLVLFKKLLSVIGEDQYLWRTLLLMLEMVVTSGRLRNELTADLHEISLGGSRPDVGDIEFCLTLCGEFSVSVQLTAARDMIQYIMNLPHDKDDDSVRQARRVPQSFGKLRKDDVKLFNVDIHSAKQLRLYKNASIKLLVNLFSSQDFVRQVAESEKEDLMVNFQGVLETSLQYIAIVTTLSNKTKDKQMEKFWKTFLHKVCHLLDKLVTILPDGMFTAVICGLVVHDLPSVQRKAMELMNTKLQQQKEIREEEATMLLPLVGQLNDMVESVTSQDEASEDELLNVQTAFITLKYLCRCIGYQNTATFLKVLKVSLQVFKNTEISVSVSSCALLCIAEICNTLKVHTIPELPHFMPLLVKVLGNHENLMQNELFLMCVITTVNKVVENLSNFLSPYLLNIIKNVCILSSKPDSDVLQKQQVQQRLKAIRTTLSTTLPTRVLLPAATSCYNQLIEGNIVCVSSLLSLMGDHLCTVSREDLTSHLSELQTFFIKCLNMRIDYPEIPEKDTSLVEGFTIDTVITMVLKLSESSFKPFLFKLFDWATSNDDMQDRVLVFYRLADSLAERLRSLFTIFAGHIISHVAKMLDLNNTIKEDESFFPPENPEKACQLLKYVLDCLTKCCLYDPDGFMTKERFETLLQPLVDQLENEMGGTEAYVERVTQHLVPCIVQVTVSSQDDSLWRALNYQVCLKTRTTDPKVKDAALDLLDHLHKKLGEEYMQLLPDTVPFLAELMEDESEEVEKKCQAVIRDMEKTLGEPLQKYF